MTNHWSSPLQFQPCDQNFCRNSLLLLLLLLTIFLQNPTLFAGFSSISILCLEHNKMQTFESKFNAIRFWQNKQNCALFFFFFWKTEERKQELRLREDLKEAEGYRICFSLSFRLGFSIFFLNFCACYRCFTAWFVSTNWVMQMLFL